MNVSKFQLTGMLAPGPGNPRNSEGAFLPLEDGRIAYAYSRYHGNSFNDHADCAICVIYSYDQGETWDTEHYETLVNAGEYGETNVMSVSLLRLGNGDIGLFYLLKHPGVTSDYILRRYDKDFSHPLGDTTCLPQGYPSYYVVNNDRVAMLTDGTLIVPAANHPTSIYRDTKNDRMDGRSTTQFFFSRDDGRTWSHGHATLHLSDTYSNTGLQEPGLVELPDGTLYCYNRTDRMYQYESVSLDGGATWFGPQSSRFTSPASPMLIKRNPANGKYYAVWNPVPEYVTRPSSKVWTGGRNPLVIAESTDGRHFSSPVVLEDDNERGFCYPAMYFLDEKTILLAYCSGGTEEGCCLNRTTLRKLILD